MELTSRTDAFQDYPVLHLAGELTVAIGPSFAKVLTEFGKAGDCLIVDMSDVDFIDSSSLGLLIAIDHRVSSAKGTLVLAGLQPEVDRIFHVTRLNERLHLAKDLGEAAALLDSSCARPEA